MNLTLTEPITEREWNLAWDIVRIQEAGGPLSLKEHALDAICGSPERALRVLATVRRYRYACTVTSRPYHGHTHRSVPRRHSGSSTATRPARRTANARAGRSDVAAHLTLILVTLAFAAFVVWEVAR